MRIGGARRGPGLERIPGYTAGGRTNRYIGRWMTSNTSDAGGDCSWSRACGLRLKAGTPEAWRIKPRGDRRSTSADVTQPLGVEAEEMNHSQSAGGRSGCRLVKGPVADNGGRADSRHECDVQGIGDGSGVFTCHGCTCRKLRTRKIPLSIRPVKGIGSERRVEREKISAAYEPQSLRGSSGAAPGGRDERGVPGVGLWGPRARVPGEPGSLRAVTPGTRTVKHRGHAKP
jgi:hypothetical protein